MFDFKLNYFNFGYWNNSPTTLSTCSRATWGMITTENTSLQLDKLENPSSYLMTDLLIVEYMQGAGIVLLV